MTLNEFLGSGLLQNAPDYSGSHLPNSKFSGGKPPCLPWLTASHTQIDDHQPPLFPRYTAHNLKSVPTYYVDRGMFPSFPWLIAIFPV